MLPHLLTGFFFALKRVLPEISYKAREKKGEREGLYVVVVVGKKIEEGLRVRLAR